MVALAQQPHVLGRDPVERRPQLIDLGSHLPVGGLELDMGLLELRIRRLDLVMRGPERLVRRLKLIVRRLDPLHLGPKTNSFIVERVPLATQALGLGNEAIADSFQLVHLGSQSAVHSLETRHFRRDPVELGTKSV